jgi:hypothetical protein
MTIERLEYEDDGDKKRIVDNDRAGFERNDQINIDEGRMICCRNAFIDASYDHKVVDNTAHGL